MATENVSAEREHYDFVLVGAGTASCLIASRLSQQLCNHRILVLEAGQHLRDDYKVSTPGLSPALQSDPLYDWQYSTVPEPGLNGRSLKHPRGKLVGGTSAINSHSVVFPNFEWHDRLAKELLPHSTKSEWSSDGMKNCYKRWQAEHSGVQLNNEKKSLDRVQTSHPHAMDGLQLQWMKAFEELGYATKLSEFAKSSPGAVSITNAIDASKGERSHAGTAFLDPALKRANVTLKTCVKVDKVIFDKPVAADGKLKAKGVCYILQGNEYLIGANEVILCAGVFESPAILERSGIGPKKILTTANISVLYELPGVGENLQDHLNCSLSCETRDHICTRDEGLRSPEMQKAALEEYQRDRTGRLAEGGAYSFAYTPLQMLEPESETQELAEMVRHSIEEEISPGLRTQYSVIQQSIQSAEEATATTFMLRSQRHRDADSLPKDTPTVVDGNYVTVVAMLAHPFSRGSCHISSDDPTHPPNIQFNYLSHPLDTEILARHLLLIERLFNHPTFSAIIKPDGKRLPRSFPQPISSLEDAKRILPINAATNYHPSSTCSMMREDLGGVVDEHLKVYGTNNLRICDASVFPVIPRGNIITAVYAFAEKAVEIICKEVELRLSSN